MRKHVRILLLWLAVLAVLLFGVYFFTLNPSPLIYHPKVFSEPKYDLIIAWMKAGKTAATGPVVVLPPELAGLSVTGRAYVTDNLVFIPSWVGRTALLDPYGPGDDEVEGFMYSAKPLAINPNDPFVTLNVPGACTPWMASHDRTVVQVPEMGLGDQIGRHWYSVATFS
jgi:hypothetical protein